MEPTLAMRRLVPMLATRQGRSPDCGKGHWKRSLSTVDWSESGWRRRGAGRCCHTKSIPWMPRCSSRQSILTFNDLRIYHKIYRSMTSHPQHQLYYFSLKQVLMWFRIQMICYRNCYTTRPASTKVTYWLFLKYERSLSLYLWLPTPVAPIRTW